MGILRRTVPLLALAALACAPSSNPPAYAADPPAHSNDASSSASALAWPMDGPQAAKRAAGPLRLEVLVRTASRPVQTAPSLQAFARRLSHRAASEVQGLYLDGRGALHVVHQPADEPTYVSSVPGTATLFRLAAEAGTLGFLAHNEAAGASFQSLALGDRVWAIYGDGRTEAFIVTGFERYQAEEPSDPYGSLVDLASGERLSAEAVFHRVYGSGHGLVLQTCLGHDGSLTWGRLFVLADPIG